LGEVKGESGFWVWLTIELIDRGGWLGRWTVTR
jgi:hypothetical protein